MNNVLTFINQTLKAKVIKDLDGSSFLSYEFEGKPHVHALDQKEIQDLICYQYFNHHDAFPDKKELRQAFEQLRMKAKFQAPMIEVPVRLAGSLERVEINIQDHRGRVLVVTPQSVSLGKPKVPFRASQTSLPIKINGRKMMTSEEARTVVSEFRALFPNLSDDMFKLMIGFQLNVLFPVGPEFIGVVVGQRGSGKSVLCDAIQLITDPSTTTRLKLEGGTEPILLAARNNRLLVLDNVSSDGFSSSYSDLLAQISTEVTIQRRKLRTDDDLHTIKVKRPVLINSIDHFVSRSDLASRMLYFRVDGLISSNLLICI